MPIKKCLIYTKPPKIPFQNTLRCKKYKSKLLNIFREQGEYKKENCSSFQPITYIFLNFLISFVKIYLKFPFSFKYKKPF